MPYRDLQIKLIESNVFGLTVKDEGELLHYKYLVMFRDNKKRPEELIITVSRRSKNVINITSDRRTFQNIDDFIDRVLVKKERA